MSTEKLSVLSSSKLDDDTVTVEKVRSHPSLLCPPTILFHNCGIVAIVGLQGRTVGKRKEGNSYPCGTLRRQSKLVMQI